MKTVLLIVSDQVFRSRLNARLNERGWHVVEAADAQRVLDLAREFQPQLIFCDWQAPQCDLARAGRNLARAADSSAHLPLIVAVGGGQIAQKIAALESGADEYIAKPVDPESLDAFLARLEGEGHANSAAQSNGAVGDIPGARIKFWGVRGSIPSPGPDTIHYGGNTSCVEVRVGQDIIVLDSGSGIHKLGLALREEFKDQPIHLNVLISHTHWDHIQGFPFFLPAYNLKNKVTICGFEGARQGLQNTLSSQMESPYFPISMQQMPGAITIRELKEMSFNVGSVPVKAHFLSHPGVCTGYRLFTPGGSISYLPDVELFQRLRTREKTDTNLARETAPEEDRSVLEFIRGSDVLIMDSQYDAAEYESHVGWGHSCVEDSVAFAVQGGVGRLFLFHHDPDHSDEQIARMVARAREMAVQWHSSLIVEAAREGCEVLLPAPPARRRD
jgi:phosphoribosyl 1,2-cyclic phosphodiesterase/ActR/RegA family two-component response regulator